MKIQIGKFTIEEISELIKVNAENDEKNVEVRKVKVYSTRALICVSIILTVMNIIKHFTVMTIATSILTVGLVIIAYLYEHGKIKVGNFLFMFLIMALFTFFAVQGKNDGFAILWIMLIPPLASSILNLRLGLIICTYFQILVVAMFYTPWNNVMRGLYTDTFIMRFPVLYLACFFVSFLIIFEKEYYENKAKILARTDVLTGLNNRRSFEEVFFKLEDNWKDIEDLTVISLDLNGLKRANDNIGHSAGDELLNGAAKCMNEAFSDAVVIARVGGDEFCVITKKSSDEVKEQTAKLSELTKNWKGKLCDKLSLSLGYASKGENPDKKILDLYNMADNAMYEDKRLYYLNNKNDRRKR